MIKGIHFFWDGLNWEGYLQVWLTNGAFKYYKELPLIFIRGVWLARNVETFKDISIAPFVVSKVIAILNAFPQVVDPAIVRRVVEVIIDITYGWDYFDCAP